MDASGFRLERQTILNHIAGGINYGIIPQVTIHVQWRRYILYPGPPLQG